MEPRILILPRETERLILRTPLSTDAAAIQEAIEESFIDLHTWMDWATTLQSLDDTKTIIERHQVNYESGENFTVSAFLKDTGKFVLNAGLHPRNWRVPKFEIGYWCRTSMLGNGYVTEVVRELTAAAFYEMAAKRVEIRCDSRNQRSRRVAEGAGYRLEAELRCDDRANDDSLRDTSVYVLLADDFHPESQGSKAAYRVQPAWGTRRVFKQLAQLEASSVKVALSHPTHQRVTPADILPRGSVIKHPIMDTLITGLRKHTIEKILAKQDDSFRWGFDQKQARERPDYCTIRPITNPRCGPCSCWPISKRLSISRISNHPSGSLPSVFMIRTISPQVVIRSGFCEAISPSTRSPRRKKSNCGSQ